MITSKHILYKELNEDTILKYSLCKFGDPQTIRVFAESMSSFIKSYMQKEKEYVVYTTDIQSKYSHKNSFLLAKEIAKILNLDLILSEYVFTYDKNNFYDNQKANNRKNHIPQLKEGNPPFKTKTVIVIDDSFVTGKTFSVILEQLSEHTNEILLFCLIDLSNQILISEKKANSYFMTTEGFESLADVVNKTDYVPTTQMLRSVEKMEKTQKDHFLNNLDNRRRILVKNSYFEYIGDSL